jgi:hypothetical protein
MMERRWALGFMAAMAFALTAQAQNQAKGARSDRRKWIIELKKVARVLVSPAKPAYSVDYSYDFADRGSVYILDLGTVPGRGRFRYITSADRIEVRETANGGVLVTKPLKETLELASKPPLLQLPDEALFPNAHQTYVWESQSPLLERTDAVLAKYFHYDPRDDKGIVYIRTTFTPLPLQNVPAGVIAQVALLISFSDDGKSDRHGFQVHTLVREGRSHSDDFRPTTNSAIVTSAEAFVRNLVAELKSPEETRKP